MEGKKSIVRSFDSNDGSEANFEEMVVIQSWKRQYLYFAQATIFGIND